MKEKEIISKVRIYDYEELSEADRELIDKAKEATQTLNSAWAQPPGCPTEGL